MKFERRKKRARGVTSKICSNISNSHYNLFLEERFPFVRRGWKRVSGRAEAFEESWRQKQIWQRTRRE